MVPDSLLKLFNRKFRARIISDPESLRPCCDALKDLMSGYSDEKLAKLSEEIDKVNEVQPICNCNIPDSVTPTLPRPKPEGPGLRLRPLEDSDGS